MLNLCLTRRVKHSCQMAIARFLDRMCLALQASGLWLRYATLQILIPSFPWIVPPRPPSWRDPRKGRDQILPSGNLGVKVNRKSKVAKARDSRVTFLRTDRLRNGADWFLDRKAFWGGNRRDVIVDCFWEEKGRQDRAVGGLRLHRMDRAIQYLGCTVLYQVVLATTPCRLCDAIIVWTKTKPKQT